MKNRKNNLLTGWLTAILMIPAVLAQSVPPAEVDQQPGNSTTLPEGHPDISEMLRQRQQAPSVLGSISVRATQGTPGAAPITSVPVTIDFYSQNAIVNQVEGELDEFGVAVFHDVPLTAGMRPVAKVEYAGVTYLEIGSAIDPANPILNMDVTVYEITEEEPEWFINERDLIIHRQPDAIIVREMVTVTNPADRTWFGIPDGSGKGDAFRVELARGAENINLGSGFHGWCCSKFNDQMLVNQMPMMPGQSRYQFEYTVPIAEGKASIDVHSPAKTSRLVIYVPDDGAKIETTGLSSGESQDFGQFKVRLYGAEEIQAGKDVALQLVGLTTPGDLAQASEASGQAKTIAGVGIGVLVVFAVVLILFLPRSKAAAAGSEEG